MLTKEKIFSENPNIGKKVCAKKIIGQTIMRK